MKSWWIKFDDGSAAHCSGESDYDARNIAEKLAGKKVASVTPLPYPAEPSVWTYEHPVYGKCPSFCYSPKQCAGRTACPQSYACSE